MAKVVELFWEDAVWEMTGDFSRFRLTKTVGYLIDQDPDHIWVCQEYDAFGEVQGVQKIPMSIVRSVLVLAE